jgi:hypothetical protein
MLHVLSLFVSFCEFVVIISNSDHTGYCGSPIVINELERMWKKTDFVNLKKKLQLLIWMN